MTKIRTVCALALAISWSGPAFAQQKGCEEAYAVGKDIARLDAEMKAMKKLLAELLELDRRRTKLLARALGEGELDLESLQPLAPGEDDGPRATEPPPSGPKPKRSTGTVTGRVRGGGGVAYVYVADVRGRLVRGKKATIAQRNRQFEPRWLVVQRGTTVEFPNEDNIYHNVFSNSPRASFDLGIYRKGDDPKSYTFTRPGVIDVFCNMHAKMSTEVLVVPNHLYTRAKKDGSFSLARIPAGRHHVVAWAPGHQLAEAWVDVPSGGDADVQLTLVPRGDSRHLNKDGQPYGSYK